jgi:hypothetical protein
VSTSPRGPRRALDDALFAAPDRVKGAGERAVERSLTGWRKAGREIDPAMSSMLRAQGFAVDLAIAKGDPWQVGNATKVYLELVGGFGLIARAGGTDPFVEAMNAAMAAADDFTD